MKQYGTKCAVCSVNRVGLVVAAHICPKHAKGSDDWRNGMVLCWTHHAAFDLGLFGFDPANLAVVFRKGCDAAGLGITAQRFGGAARPHPNAVAYHAERWKLVEATKP